MDINLTPLLAILQDLLVARSTIRTAVNITVLSAIDGAGGQVVVILVGETNSVIDSIIVRIHANFGFDSQIG